MSAPKSLTTTHLKAALRKQLERHPYGTVALAASIGYILGTRLGGPLLALLSSRIGMDLTSSLLAPSFEQAAERV